LSRGDIRRRRRLLLADPRPARRAGPAARADRRLASAGRRIRRIVGRRRRSGRRRGGLAGRRHVLQPFRREEEPPARGSGGTRDRIFGDQRGARRPPRRTVPVDRRPRAVIPLLIGLAALVVGTLFGWDTRLLDAIVTPPALIR